MLFPSHLKRIQNLVKIRIGINNTFSEMLIHTCNIDDYKNDVIRRTGNYFSSKAVSHFENNRH